MGFLKKLGKKAKKLTKKITKNAGPLLASKLLSKTVAKGLEVVGAKGLAKDYLKFTKKTTDFAQDAIINYAASILPGVGGAYAGAVLSEVGSKALGSSTMGFFDDVGSTFSELSGAVKKGSEAYNSFKNFGKNNAGGGGSTAHSGEVQYGPALPPSMKAGIPAWALVAGGGVALYFLLRKK